MDEKRINFNDGVKITLFALIVFTVLTLPAALFQGDLKLYAGYLAPQLAFFFVPLFYIKSKGASYAETALLKAPLSWKSALLTIPVTVGVYMQNLLLAVSFSWLMESLGITMHVDLPALNSSGSIIAALFFIAVLPAIGEETLFRGVLVNTAKERGKVFALFVPALIFTLMHGNPAQLVHQYLLAVVLSYIAIRTGSIVYTMLIHFFNNAIALTLPYIIPAYNQLGILSARSAIIMAVMMVVGILILYPSVWLLIKFSREKPLTKEELNIFAFLRKKEDASCYNVNNIVKEKRGNLLFILIAVLMAILILNTVLLSIPGLMEALN